MPTARRRNSLDVLLFLPPLIILDHSLGTPTPLTREVTCLPGREGRHDDVSGEKKEQHAASNCRSSLSFMGSVVNYFNSEWSEP